MVNGRYRGRQSPYCPSVDHELLERLGRYAFGQLEPSPNMSWKIDCDSVVEVVEDLAALGTKIVGLVEDRGDPALLVQRR